MKIWFDILTPKQLLFFEPLIRRLEKDHKVICTSRKYRELTYLAKKRKFDSIMIGSHGGKEKSDKLIASISRMKKLTTMFKNDLPDLAVSFCSPDCSRVAFGLGINHFAFCDAPHAEAVMKLSIPLIQKLFTPWIIHKTNFTKYGILTKNIVHYRAIDAAIIIKGKTVKSNLQSRIDKNKKTILFRPYETQAAYAHEKKTNLLLIIKKISNEFPNCNLIVLGRYIEQISQLKKELKEKIIIFDEIVDSGEILSITDVFIGSGGTMTAESSLRGIPTISYDAIPNIVEDYLVKRGLVIRHKDPDKIIKQTKKFLSIDKSLIFDKAKKEIRIMEDPFDVFLRVLKRHTV